MPKPSAPWRSLVVVILAVCTAPARAVDVTGTWAVCLHQTGDPFCPPTFDATLVGTGTTFRMIFPSLGCGDVVGTIDAGTGAMTAPHVPTNCLGNNGALNGVATDTSMSGAIYLNEAICAFQFDAVRECGACADSDGCTTDGCGTTACLAPSSTCTYVQAPVGTACSDGNPCTVGDMCTNTGACVGGLVVCGDGNPCTDDSCDPGTGQCLFVPNTAPCNDGTVCTVNDTCSGGHCVSGPPLVCPPCRRCGAFLGCVVGPKVGCKTPVDPAKSQIVLRNSATDTRDKLAWKWSSGTATSAADLGDPVTATDYTLCVFDQAATTPRLVLSSAAPAASTCPFGPTGSPCWRALGDPPGSKGFVYRNAGLFSPGGAAKLKIGPGTQGHAKASMKGQGANLHMPSPLDLTPPVRVQLQAENGQCWEASYPSALQDREDVFRAKGGN